MKRFASFVTAFALAGSLVGAGNAAQGQSALYLVPISPLNATYAPGSIVRCAAVLDLNTSAFASLTVPFALAFTSAEFSYTGTLKPRVDGQNAQIDPYNPGSTVFPFNLQAYTTTASKINGNRVYTVQNTAGHAADTDANGATLALPGGTYTIGTFAFPISSANTSGSATIYMPTPFGFSNTADATDGDYSVGTGPLNMLAGRGVLVFVLREPIIFPNSGGKCSSLTYLVGDPSYIPPTTTIVSGPANNSTLSNNSATFTFTGTSPVTSTANLRYVYSLDSSPFSAPSANTTVTFDGLSAGTHLFQVAAMDSAGHIDGSPPTRRFNVLNPTPLIISYVTVPNAMSATYTIGWVTDRPATSQVAYRAAGAANFTFTSLNINLTLAHSVTLSGLLAGVIYDCYVISQDAYGVSADTSAALSDFYTSPNSNSPGVQIVTGPASGDTLFSNHISFTFTATDLVTPTANLRYEYALDSSVYTPPALSTTAAFTGLADGQHTFSVIAVDDAGNMSYPQYRYFSVDTRPDLFSNIQSAPSFASAVITWTTSVSAGGQVNYRVAGTTPWLTTPLQSAAVQSHLATITGLIGDTAYEYQVVAVDSQGTSVTSPIQTFTTLHDGRPLVAVNDYVNVAPNVPAVLAVLANDSSPQGYALTVSAVTQGGHGAVSVNADNTLTYAPAPGFTGTDAFKYTISDGHGGTASASVSVAVGTVSISGTIMLEGCVNFAQSVIVTLRPLDGSQILTRVLTLTANGKFGFNVPARDYLLAIKGAIWLQRDFSADGSQGASTSITAMLTAGDANNDNKVDSADFAILIAAYNSDITLPGSGYDVRADFNCDGLVDSVDFGLLIGEFNQHGEL